VAYLEWFLVIEKKNVLEERDIGLDGESEVIMDEVKVELVIFF
jgi:hypothetical protein